MDNYKEQTLLKTLEHSVTIIKQWHNMQPYKARWLKSEIKQTWDIYYNHAPEMKSIREAINQFKK